MITISFGIAPLTIFPAIFYLSFKWPSPKDSVGDISRIGAPKRIFAFFIDLHVAMPGMLPIVCMPTLFLEYLSTGVWVWSFERNFSRASDLISVPLIFFGVLGLGYYWSWHHKNKKQTFAQRLLRFT